MTPQDSRRITHLLTLADLVQDSPTIDIKFCSYWDSLCEDIGKAKLLLLIKELVEASKPTQ
jgi:hypothetical protein